MNDRWILEALSKAIGRLEAALAEPATGDVMKAGCIQYFEFCFELAWKAIRQAGTMQGLQDCLSPRGCLKQAYANGWVDHEEIWLEMLDARNRMSHTYKAEEALRVYDRLCHFLVQLKSLAARLEVLP